MEADALIRDRSDGKRSLDDFAKLFFGVDNGRFTPVTYRFEDVVDALNRIEPYDWSKFLNEHLHHTGKATLPFDLTPTGYHLVFTDTASEFSKAIETDRKRDDFWFSLGFNTDKDGKLTNVLWDGPAYKAGLTPGAQVIAVNGVAFDADKLRDTVRAGKGKADPLELLVRTDDRYRTVTIDYHDGLKYPHLERVESVPARLDDILAPKP
jgi:predicted metalloprotease with PDZ domain